MDQITRLMSRIAALEATVKDLGTPQLQASSISVGSLDHVVMVETGEVDEHGEPIMRPDTVARLGVQEDGTNGLVILQGPPPPPPPPPPPGPTPPSPTEPTIAAGPGYIAVTWDGLFEDGETAPLDFLHVAVHVALEDAVADDMIVMPSPDTLRNVISTTHGATVVVGDLDPGTYLVSLVTVTTAGMWSEPASYSLGGPGDPATGIDVEAREAAQVALEAAQSAAQAASTAQMTATTALRSADGKTSTWYSPDPPAAQGADGDTWYQRDPASGRVTRVFERLAGTWQERKLTSTTIDTITAAQIDTGVLRAGVGIITGDPAGAHVELGSSALISWRTVDAERGPEPVTRIGGGNGTDALDVVQLIDPGTDIVSGFDATGSATFQGTSVQSLTIGGTPIGSPEREDILWPLPRGIVGIYRPTVDGPDTQATETGVCFATATCLPYRRYRAIWDGNVYATSPSILGRLVLRITSDGSTPTTASSQIGMRIFETPSRVTHCGTHIEADFFVGGFHGDEVPVQVMLSLQRVAGDGSIRYHSDAGHTLGALTILDLGTHSGANADVYDDGGMTTGGAKVTRTKTWMCAWTKAWRSGVASGTDVRTGYSSGQWTSAVGFPDDMYATLAGSTITKVEVYLCAKSWAATSGGTARLGAHAATTAPATMPASSGIYDVTWTSRSGGRWITLPTAWLPAFATGRNRGITLGVGVDRTPKWSGLFYGAGTEYRPAVRVTYRK